jgi:Tol biopolymer transport system component
MLFRNLDLITINADGSNLEVILSRQKIFESLSIDIPEVVKSFTTISPDGKKFAIGVCGYADCYPSGMIISTTDLANTKAIDYYLGYNWSPDSNRLLMEYVSNVIGSDGFPFYALNVTEDGFGRMKKLPNASSSFWSFDGKKIYYFYMGKYYIINNDGSGSRSQKCTACPTNAYSYRGAVSPDGQKIAVSYTDGSLVIANADFSNSRQITIGQVDDLIWSPDSKTILIKINNKPELILVNENSDVVGKILLQSTGYIRLCGWSPDGRQLAYNVTTNYSSGQSSVFIQDIKSESSLELLPVESGGQLSCPIWFSTNSDP